VVCWPAQPRRRRSLSLRNSIVLALLALALAAARGEAASFAFPITPRSTSVEAGTSKVFRVRFSETNGQGSAGATVVFTNDACGTFSNGLLTNTVIADANGVASDTFTATPGLTGTCRIMASSGAVATFDVITYHPDLPTVVATTDPSPPRAGERFVLDLRFMIGSQILYDVELLIRTAAGSAPATIIPETGNTWPTGSLASSVTQDKPGNFALEVVVGGRVYPVNLPFEIPTLSLQDMWWAAPQENGWGIAIVQHGDRLVPIVFSYDATGKPAWYTMPGGSWDAARRSFSGLVYRPRGAPFYAYDATRFVPGSPVGTLTFRWTDNDNAEVIGTIEGTSFTRRLVRMEYGNPNVKDIPNETDLWWGGPSQDGWGISMIQHFDAVFSVWYTYDAQGVATWYVMPGGAFTGARTYEGRVFRTTGTPVGATYDPFRFTVTEVGTYRVRFLDTSAIFDYTVEGRTGTLTLFRQPF
jgi:hypothetical protein